MAKKNIKIRGEEHEKLRRLPEGAKVTKRPLIRPAIPSPYASKNEAKVIYLGSKTPFMSSVKRVKQLFKHIDQRSTQADLVRQRNVAKRRHGNPGQPSLNVGDEVAEPVIIKATGKAIDKALQLALFLQQQPEYQVKITTGSVAAIDDIIMGSDYVKDDHTTVNSRNDQIEVENEVPRDTDIDMVELATATTSEVVKKEQKSDSEQEESRIRFTSVIEIVVTLR